MNWHYLTLKSQSISLPSPPIPLTHKGSYGRENYLKLKKNSALSKSRRGELHLLFFPLLKVIVTTGPRVSFLSFFVRSKQRIGDSVV